MTAEEDEASQILKQWVPNWHNVRDLNSNSLLSYIRTLEIKILVDLSGHTENSKLDVFATSCTRASNPVGIRPYPRNKRNRLQINRL